MIHEVPRLTVESPNGQFAAVVTTTDHTSRGLRLLVQSVRIVKRVQSGQVVELETFGSSVAAIHSCENDDIEVHWSNETELAICYSQSKPDWVSFVKIVEGITISLIEKEPIQ